MDLIIKQEEEEDDDRVSEDERQKKLIKKENENIQNQNKSQEFKIDKMKCDGTEDKTTRLLFVANLPPRLSKEHIELFFREVLKKLKENLTEDQLLQTVKVVAHYIPQCICTLLVPNENCRNSLVSISGIILLNNYLLLTYPNCLPSPNFQNLPIDIQSMPDPRPYLSTWHGRYLLFSNLSPQISEHELRVILESAAEGVSSVDQLIIYDMNNKIENFNNIVKNENENIKKFNRCGSILFVNASVNSGVVKKLNNFDLKGFGQPLRISVGIQFSSVNILSPNFEDEENDDDYENGRSLISKTGSNVFALDSSISFQIARDPLLATQVFSSRKIGAIPSPVVQLLNVLSLQDLLSDILFESILLDVTEEAQLLGHTESVVIPRPKVNQKSDTLEELDGCGKVFIHYSDLTAARRAQVEFNGRVFNNSQRVICAAFYPLDRFLNNIHSLMAP